MPIQPNRVVVGTVVMTAALAAAGAAHKKSFFTVGAQEDGRHVVPNGPTAARLSGNNMVAYTQTSTGSVRGFIDAATHRSPRRQARMPISNHSSRR